MGISTPCYTTIKEQNHISHMGIRTPCYTTIKEQNHISHIGIRTPCYTTMIEQHYVCLELLFQSSHSYVFAILQVLISASTKPSYNTTKELNRISHMGIRTLCYTATEEQHYVGKTGIRTPSYVTKKDQNYVAKLISEHHAILQ